MNYTIKNDVIFSYLFSQEDIVKDFLEVCLDKKIKNVEVSSQFSLDKFDIRNKGAVLDIKAIINDEEHVDIEMQRKKDDFYVKRVLLYTGGLLRGQVNRGDTYEYMKNVIMINILDYTLFKNIKEYHTIWKLRENNNLGHEPLEGLEVHFLELEKFRKSNPNLHEKLNQWLATIDTENKEWLEVAMKENQKIKEVVEKKDNFVNDDILARQIIEAQEKWDLDYRTGISCAKKKGIAEGRASGLTEGYESGLTEGYESGLAEGKLEKEKLIKDLLKMNIDIETISKATGFTKDELNKLKEEI